MNLSVPNGFRRIFFCPYIFRPYFKVLNSFRYKKCSKHFPVLALRRATNAKKFYNERPTQSFV